MLEKLLDVMRCPVCREGLHLVGKSLRCGNRHTFDIARQGYVNLLGGVAPAATGDSADMVRARAEFQGAGHFEPLARVLAAAASEATGDVVLDAGAGTGYYLAAVLDELATARGLALDVSKFAARQAARAHERIGAAVWDSWRPLPVHDQAVDIVLNVFAPRNGAEFRRILRPNGTALVVTPQSTHLAELSRITGVLQVDPDKDDRLDRSLTPHLDLSNRFDLAFPLALSAMDAERLVRMGPSSYHVAPSVLEDHLTELGEPVAVTVAVTISRFRRPPR